MTTQELLLNLLQDRCLEVHQSRLLAVLDVAEGLRHSQNMSLSAIGRHLPGNALIKHKIKKVDRCLGNTKLHTELKQLYGGLSYFIFQYIKHIAELPIIVDLCHLKDDRQVQMLSAHLAAKGRAIPLYNEVFKEGELKGRAKGFLKNLSELIPKDKKVILIMDAGFSVEWFEQIEKRQWYWINRIRQGKSLKIEKNGIWMSIREFIPQVSKKTQEYQNSFLTKEHDYPCRIVTTHRELKGRKQKISRGQTSSKWGGGSYSAAGREPWILATNIKADTLTKTQIVLLYSKRMQIEETFREIKSHQFGLSGRYVRTSNINRWSTLLLLASIAIISYWIIGIIAHSQGLQKVFQSNTIKDRKVFSYITLGKFIIELNKLNLVSFSDQSSLAELIEKELGC